MDTPPKWEETAEVPPSFEETTEVPVAASAQPATPVNEDLIDRLMNYAPAVGGLIGGIAGLPADLPTLGGSSIAGAGAGAAGGEALKNLIHEYRHPEAPKKDIGDDLIEGGKNALAQATGEKVIAPILSPVLSKIGGPVADYLAQKMGKVADWATMKATGATGAQVYKTFPEGAAPLLRKMGIVAAGDTQKAIAAKADAALEASGKGIESALSQLDAKGAYVPRDVIVKRLRDKAQELGKDLSQSKVAKALNALADEAEGGVEPVVSTEAQSELATDVPEQSTSLIPERVPLSAAEKTKRGFQADVNYNSSPYEHSVADEAANIYRSEVEKRATAVDPSLADKFKADKQTYGALNPISEATGKRAAAIAAKQGINFHALGTTGMGALVGGEEGYRHGGFGGALTGTVLGSVIGARAPSTIAAGADAISQFLGKDLAAPAVAAATQVYGSNRLSEVLRKNPQALGQFAPQLQKAAERGETALNAAHFVLQQTNPEYREKSKALFGDQNGTQPATDGQ